MAPAGAWPAAADGLTRAIRASAAGDVYLDPAIAGKALRRSTVSAPSEHAALTEREVEAIKLVAQGFSNKEIAGRLALGIKTAETYRARAAEKLGLRTRADIVQGRTSCGTTPCEGGFTEL